MTTQEIIQKIVTEVRAGCESSESIEPKEVEFEIGLTGDGNVAVMNAPVVTIRFIVKI